VTRPGAKGWIALGALWLAGVTGTLAWAAVYRATSGAPAAAPAWWPAGSTLHLDERRPALVMLVHPRCPCTRASIIELARLMTEVGDRVAAHVVFVRPPGVQRDWEQTETWRAAQRISGVTVHVDEAGVEAHRFGAETSGQVVAFSPEGAMLFSGGITGARDHVGDNAGHDALRRVILGETLRVAEGPVYGCPLHDATPLSGGRP
jgi:hypothetical protein